MAASRKASARGPGAGYLAQMLRPYLEWFLTSQIPFSAQFDFAPSISRDRAFLGLLRLIARAFSERLRPSNRTRIHERAALPDHLPRDRLVIRRHGDQRRDPDRRRGVWSGVCRRLGARDSVRARRHRSPYPAGGAVRGRRLRDGGVHPRRAARRAVHEARVSLVAARKPCAAWLK